MHFDVFNGDADGIISLLQLRWAEPKTSTLVTGVKRDIQLVKHIPVETASSATILDISMAKNHADLQKLLASGCPVFYADHHQPGDIPKSSLLDAHIDLDANTCTALIVDRYLNGRYHTWAIAAAYGDNLLATADDLASKAGLTDEQAKSLKELGTLINYNGYGESLNDLHFNPAELYGLLTQYQNPFDAILDTASPFHRLKAGYEEDWQRVEQLNPEYHDHNVRVFKLDNSESSRRISGVFGNHLANQSPEHAHLVVTGNAKQGYTISLRAPLANKQGAGDICGQFESGGGRAAAGGINHLPKDQLSKLIGHVSSYYGQ